jgi:PTH1 family peptidyl-tRNA hydrolase
LTRLVVGLGNPGPDHLGSRHNVGFEVVEHLALREGLLFEPGAHLEGFPGPTDFEFARAHVPDVLLVRPLTFMNRSGDVVGPLVTWNGGELSSLLVVVDDLDLDVGRLRIRSRGGHGGQNGMRSIIGNLSDDSFPRLRVGLGRPRTDAVRHVLGRFTAEERPLIDDAVARAADAIWDWLVGGDIDRTMSRFHSRWTLDSKARSDDERDTGLQQ